MPANNKHTDDKSPENSLFKFLKSIWQVPRNLGKAIYDKIGQMDRTRYKYLMVAFTLVLCTFGGLIMRQIKFFQYENAYFLIDTAWPLAAIIATIGVFLVLNLLSLPEQKPNAQKKWDKGRFVFLATFLALVIGFTIACIELVYKRTIPGEHKKQRYIIGQLTHQTAALIHSNGWDIENPPYSKIFKYYENLENPNNEPVQYQIWQEGTGQYSELVIYILYGLMMLFAISALISLLFRKHLPSIKTVDLTASKPILMFSANPYSTERLRIDKEMREIQQELLRAVPPIKYHLATIPAVRSADMLRALLHIKPVIIHFSGHSISHKGQDNQHPKNSIIIEDELKGSELIDAETLSSIFAKHKESIKCVILNSCYSEEQAKHIVKHIPYVIGMSNAIRDESAIEFSKGFYMALAQGRSIPEAYEYGKDLASVKDKSISAKILKKEDEA